MLQYRNHARRVPIACGTIIYVQDAATPFRAPLRIVRRDPSVVLAWLPREYVAYRDGRFVTTSMSGGHLALIRSLRDGSTRVVADWLLRISEEVAGGK